MSHRELQLGVINEPVIIQQDYDLLEHIQQNNITEAYGFGDIEYFQNFIHFTSQPAKFGIMIINKQYYNFTWIKNIVNSALQNNIQTGGVVYLALNKFLARNTKQDSIVESNYDLAIEHFIRININATIGSYMYEPNDRGQSFNFVHPLTRFYLHK